jgi:hypothetical protein
MCLQAISIAEDMFLEELPRVQSSRTEHNKLIKIDWLVHHCIKIF